MGSYTIERFGSIHPRVQTNCGLGNTIPGQELEWVSVNGLLVSSRPIKFNISWDRLNKEGLVYGKKIAIDGKSYTCRLVKNYPGPKGNWEWHDILGMTSYDDGLWHWKRCWSWSQDRGKDPSTDDYCGVFGYSCAHGEGWILPSTRSQQIGWRPVLDRPSMELCRANIGKMISFGCDGMVYKGELADFSDYDLLVDFINPMPVLELGHAVQTDDLSFVFDRAQLDFIHEL